MPGMLDWGCCIGILEKNMETTGLIGVYIYMFDIGIMERERQLPYWVIYSITLRDSHLPP